MTVVLPTLDEWPLVVLHLHNVCNMRCPYCVVDPRSRDGFGRIADAAVRASIVRFFASRKPYQILLTGGEPLITPGLSEMIEALVAQGHRIGLQTNLKAGAERFMRAVSPERTSYVMTTFHSVILPQLSAYLDVVSEMKARGYPIAVKLVLDEVMLEEFPRVYELCVERGVGVFLSPRLYFPRDGSVHPHVYDAAQWRAIAGRVTMVSSWLSFAGGWRSRGRPCRAGQTFFYAWATKGTIHGCSHGFPRHLGDLYEDGLEPLPEMPRCELDQCICDCHTYVGVTPGLDDSERFGQLLSGPCGPVPFDDYLAFVAEARVTPFVDLRPVMSKAGIWDGEPVASGAALPAAGESSD